MKILIATGIYPPSIGGPATYAKNIRDIWQSQGHDVRVATFTYERSLPTGLRHIAYLLKVLCRGFDADMIVVLDTFSAALPAMLASRLMGKEYIIRTGGDFLWEAYVERTGQRVLLSRFYDMTANNWSLRERLIFKLTRAVLRRAKGVIYSTEWQRGIFEEAYNLDSKRSSIVENMYGRKEAPCEQPNRTFIAGNRRIKLKNIPAVESAFREAREEAARLNLPEISLDLNHYAHAEFLEKIRCAYAVMVVSLGDISPNTVLEALRFNVPCIVTKENGLNERIKEHVLLVDPLDTRDIKEKIVWLADPKNREEMVEKIAGMNYVHTWEDIAGEIIDVWKRAI